MYCLKIQKNGKVQKLFCKSRTKLKELVKTLKDKKMQTIYVNGSKIEFNCKRVSVSGEDRGSELEEDNDGRPMMSAIAHSDDVRTIAEGREDIRKAKNILKERNL